MQPLLTTGRLLLRPLAAGDGPELAGVFEGEGVRQFLFDAEDVSPETLAAIVGESLRQSGDGLGMWLITRADNVIGCIGLHRAPLSTVRIFPAFDGEIEAVIALTEAHWGDGYASEALEAALVYVSGQLNARRIVAVIDVPNARSHALFQRVGFRRLGSGQGPLYEAIAYERMAPE